MSTNRWILEHIHTNIRLEINSAVFTIGRNIHANILSKQSAISRHHANFIITEEKILYVQDLQSSNGTFINDKRVPAMDLVQVRPGDIVAFGYAQAIDPTRSRTLLNTIPVYRVEHRMLNEDVIIIDDDDEIDVKNIKKELNQPSTSYSAHSTSGFRKGFSNGIKMKKECNGASPSEFSAAVDDYIVLSSDEDEEYSMECSQIARLVASVKKESQENHGDDQFLQIKQELADLDYAEQRSDLVVDIYDSFSNTGDLLNFLQDADESSGQSVTSPIAEPSPEPIASPIADETEPIPPKLRPSAKQKYKKPPIVEPHIIKKHKSMSKPEAPPKAVSVKRKTVDKPETNESKKSRHSSADERKKKLKDLALQSSPEATTKDKKVLSKPKVKVSDGRGGFLLEASIPGPSKSKDSSGKNKPVPSKASRPSSNGDVSTPIAPRPSLNELSTRSCEKPPVIDIRQHLHRQENRPNGHNGRIVPINLPSPHVGDVIGKIVTWSANWLEEQKNFRQVPPVVSHEPVAMVPTFNTFKDYERSVEPLLMMELWQNSYMNYNEKQRAAFRSVVIHSRQVKHNLYIDTECYISEQDDLASNVPRSDDLGLIELMFQDAENDKIRMIYLSFACITECTRHTLNSNSDVHMKMAQMCSGIPKIHVKMKMVTRNPLNKIFVGHKVIVQIITNIGYYFQSVKCVRMLENSSLLPLVIQPKLPDYKLPRIENKPLVVHNKLNKLQRLIVHEACQICTRDKPGIYLIKGPPGTGKSTVIVNIILQLLLDNNNNNNNQRILLTAPSNQAIDMLILKLMDIRHKLPPAQAKQIKLIRIGPETRIHKRVKKYTLSGLTTFHLMSPYTQLRECREAIAKGSFNEEQFLRKKLEKSYYYERQKAEEMYVLNSNIICTTLTSSTNYRIYEAVKRGQYKFSCCITDEATQCTEVEALLPLRLGIEKFVFVGDPKQLSATILCMDAKELGFDQSLFSRISGNFAKQSAETQISSPMRMLEEQYRMHKEICLFPNKAFYESKLRTNVRFENKIRPNIAPYKLFNILDHDNNIAYFNTREIVLIRNLIDIIRLTVHEKCKYSIGVITPYTAQRDMIIGDLAKLSINPKQITINVNTVDSFQGSEEDIIIISCVRIDSNNFIQNENRLNVALTRAKQALYIIGSYSLFDVSRTLYDLREDAKKRKLCVDVKSIDEAIPTLRKELFN